MHARTKVKHYFVDFIAAAARLPTEANRQSPAEFREDINVNVRMLEENVGEPGDDEVGSVFGNKARQTTMVVRLNTIGSTDGAPDDILDDYAQLIEDAIEGEDGEHAHYVGDGEVYVEYRGMTLDTDAEAGDEGGQMDMVFSVVYRTPVGNSSTIG